MPATLMPDWRGVGGLSQTKGVSGVSSAISRREVESAFLALKEDRQGEISPATRNSIRVLLNDAADNWNRGAGPRFVSLFQIAHPIAGADAVRKKPWEFRQSLHLDLGDSGVPLGMGSGLAVAIRSVHPLLFKEMNEQALRDAARLSAETRISMRVNSGTLLGCEQLDSIKEDYPRAFFVAALHVKDKRPIESRARDVVRAGAAFAIVGIREPRQLDDAMNVLAPKKRAPRTIDLDINICDHLGESRDRGAHAFDEVVNILARAGDLEPSPMVTADGVSSAAGRRALFEASETASFDPSRLLIRSLDLVSAPEIVAHGVYL